MGWTHTWGRPSDVKEFIRRQYEGPESPYTVRDIALYLHEAYIALHDAEHDRTVCAVWLLRYGQDGFSYRPLDEGMGPRAARCPARILDQLSEPAPTAAAQHWRERCHDRLLARAARPRLQAGDRIRLAEPARFTDGVARDEFTVVMIGRRRRFESDDGALCRFDVKALDYEVIGRPDAGAFDPADGA